MSLAAYSQPMTDRMRVKHGTQARFTVKAGRKVLEDRLIPVQTIGGAMTVAGITYNRLSMSGGLSWWDPSSGKPVSRPKITVRFRAEDVLTGDQLCTCSICT